MVLPILQTKNVLRIPKNRQREVPAVQFNPTMNGGGRSVLILGQMCRMMFGDKVKPLSGNKGTRTNEHGPKTRQGRMSRIRTNVYAYGLNWSYAYGMN